MWPFVSKKKIVEKVERPYHISLKESTKEKKIEKLADKLTEVLSNTQKEVIFLGVGSDRSTGDSFGPMVGSMLKKKEIPFPIYGTIEEPVHALNLKKILQEITLQHNGPFIVGIDACLGDESQIGLIILNEGSFIPGNALNKRLPSVGDFHMKAIVNYLDPISPVQSLSSTRLHTVIKLAEIMTKIITQSILTKKTPNKV
ncbi:spore protease YyaC [Neobacillus drentensis]|uniref:spore protease YyaC n=1 Tax=Neobacillus drentensis TaxID=220684 RepID=UPI003000BD4E